MDQQGPNQPPSMGVVGGGLQFPYGSGFYEPNQIAGTQNAAGSMIGAVQATSQHGSSQLAFQQMHQQLQQQLHNFWENQSREIEKATDFKNHSLPLARIKKIMKADEDVRMISAEAPVVFARACEMFILELTLRSWNHTEENKRRTLQKNDIAAAITRTDIFDFLVDIVPRDDPKDEVLGSFPRGAMGVGAPAEGIPYDHMPPQHPGMMTGMYGQPPHPYMVPQMWPHVPDQHQSSSDQ